MGRRAQFSDDLAGFDRVWGLAAEESTEQIQADDAIAIGDRQNLIVSKVPVVRPGDGGGIGVCGTHRAGGSGEQVVEGGGREVRDVVAHAVGAAAGWAFAARESSPRESTSSPSAAQRPKASTAWAIVPAYPNDDTPPIRDAHAFSAVPAFETWQGITHGLSRIAPPTCKALRPHLELPPL